MSSQQVLDENKPLRSEEDNVVDVAVEVVAASPKQQVDDAGAEQKSPETKKQTDYVKEVSSACNKCYNWFPVGMFGWFGGIGLIACCIVDIFITALTLTQFFMIALLICAGLIMVVVEMPSVIVNKQRSLQIIQLALYEWLKLLSTMWGKSIYCVIIIVMCFSEVGGGFRAIPWIGGIYFLALFALYLIFGLLAAKKYNGLYIYIMDSVDDKEVEANQVFEEMFDNLDAGETGVIGPSHIAKLAVDAGLELSNSECHGIFCYLDMECNGEIVKDNWVRMWMKNPKMICM